MTSKHAQLGVHHVRVSVFTNEIGRKAAKLEEPVGVDGGEIEIASGAENMCASVVFYPQPDVRRWWLRPDVAVIATSGSVEQNLSVARSV